MKTTNHKEKLAGVNVTVFTKGLVEHEGMVVDLSKSSLGFYRYSYSTELTPERLNKNYRYKIFSGLFKASEDAEKSLIEWLKQVKIILQLEKERI